LGGYDDKDVPRFLRGGEDLKLTFDRRSKPKLTAKSNPKRSACMQRTVGFCGALAIVLGLVAQAHADVLVQVGTHNLLPNTPGQVIDIDVSSADQTEGLVFAITVSGGGVPWGGSAGPTITSLTLTDQPDVVGGVDNAYVFNPIGGGTNTPNETVFDPQFVARDFLTSSGTVLANGRLARLVIDTTGFFGGDYPLQMEGDTIDNNIGQTGLISQGDFIPWHVDTELSGLIHIVPEPSSVVLGLIGVAGLGIVAIRKRRARRA
jgi:hypothetical protein